MSEHTDRVLEDMGKSPGFAEHVERTLGWHLEHKRLGFADPIADLYEELLNEKAQLSEEDTTFNIENVEPNTTKGAQSVKNVSDHINRQAALDALEQRFAHYIKQFDYDSYEKADDKIKLVCDGIADSIDIIDTIPSADVVEVVRCKDCKNWEVKEDNGFYFFETCVLSGFHTTCDDYCSYGERRTDCEIN